jgi:ArsR family transcriptional regulator
MPRQKKELSDAALEMIAARFKLLAEPLRLKILHALWEGELTVGEIVTVTGALQANVSKHLGILQLAGLVRRRRVGLNMYYAIADETVFALCEVVCNSLHDRLVLQMEQLPASAGQRGMER